MRARLSERAGAHLVEENLLRCAPQARLLSLSEGAATCNGLLLQRRRRSVEHKHGVNVQEEQLTQPAEEAENGCVLQHLARIVTHRLDELDQPDGRVDSKPFPRERFQRHPAAARGEEVPESRDTHAGADVDAVPPARLGQGAIRKHPDRFERSVWANWSRTLGCRHSAHLIRHAPHRHAPPGATQASGAPAARRCSRRLRCATGGCRPSAAPPPPCPVGGHLVPSGASRASGARRAAPSTPRRSRPMHICT